MKYYETEFTISPYSTDASDLVAALAGEAGFETFEETTTGLLGYVQQSKFSDETLREALADFPIVGVTVTYTIREAEDRDWNEQWEQEGFEPIIVRSEHREAIGANGSIIVIHDGRHLPDPSLLPPSSSLIISIEIDARQAFGTGTHETTRMVCATLLELLAPSHNHPTPFNVLDCGTGTGILSICALKLGVQEAVGYDIDEWSVDNARHNAVINHVDDRLTALLGDASLLINKVEGPFSLIMANINRNILINDLPLFRQRLTPDGALILSGFYTADIPLLVERAATLGLGLLQQNEENDWACLVFRQAQSS